MMAAKVDPSLWNETLQTKNADRVHALYPVRVVGAGQIRLLNVSAPVRRWRERFTLSDPKR